MKKQLIILLAFCLKTGIFFGQSIADFTGPASSVENGNTFDLGLSIKNTTANQVYTFELNLGEGIELNSLYFGVNESKMTQIGAISNNSNIYTFQIKALVDEDALGFVMKSKSTGNCNGVANRQISIKLASQTPLFKELSVIKPIVPAYIYPYTLETGTAATPLALGLNYSNYGADLKVSNVVIDYDPSKIEFLISHRYNNNNGFNSQSPLITPGSTSGIAPLTRAQIAIPYSPTLLDNDQVAFYFRVLEAGYNLSDVKFRIDYVGSYNGCDNLSVNGAFSGSSGILTGVLESKFEFNNPGAVCSNSDAILSTNLEANFVYGNTTIAGRTIVLKPETGVTDVKINSVSLTLNSGVFTYTIPTDANLQYDFVLSYKHNVATTSKALDLKFGNESSYNTAIYTTKVNCSESAKLMTLTEMYKNSTDNFVYYPSFDLGESTVIKLQISDNNLSDQFSGKNIAYSPNENMEFYLDANSEFYVYYQEVIGGIPSSLVRLKNGLSKNGLKYKNIVYTKAANNKILISFNDIDGKSNNNLNFFVQANVKENAELSSNQLYSSIDISETNAVNPIQLSRGYWVLNTSNLESVVLSVNAICGAGNITTEVQKSANFKVNYAIETRNQNRMILRTTDKIIIPIPTGAIYQNFAMTRIKGVVANLYPFKITNDFYVATFLTENEANKRIEITPKNNFTIQGFRGIKVTVEYKSIGIVNSTIPIISHKLSGYLSNNLPKSAVEKTSGLPSLKVVNTVVCSEPEPCQNCVTSFAPQRGEVYYLSAWIKVDYRGANEGFTPKSYENVGIEISFPESEITNLHMYSPSEEDPIIDGWQRIEGSFTVPEDGSAIKINLVNNDTEGREAYFDDIRIHPFRSNMKSFVYDPSTQRLTAELDENNYATFYEYDDEGNLIRVKKETERGVMTIQETRINQSKINNTTTTVGQ